MKKVNVAEMLDVCSVHISQTKCGVVQVSLQRLSEIADILNLDIAVLFSDMAYFSSLYGCFELFEIIKAWSSRYHNLLAALAKTLDECFYLYKKK